METHVKNAIGIMLALLVVSCSNDDLPTDPVESEPVKIQFESDTFYSENSQDNDITILFDKSAYQAGTITVKVISDAPLFFNTIPTAINNEIIIPVAKGALYAKFKFNPRDDWFIDGHKIITFELKTVSTGFTIGTNNDILIDLLDDELRGKPLSYETVSGNNKIKKTYEYLQDGKLAKVKLETQSSQGTNITTYTYNYDAHDKLNMIQNSNGAMEYFSWENGKIVKSDYMEDGIITRSKIYLYTNEGKVESVNINERNANSTYDKTTVETYDYVNGNLKKKEVWVAENLFTWNLVSTQIYDTYAQQENPFQMNEVLPTVILQPHLPLSLRIEENGGNVLLNYTYEYNSTNRPVKRIATGEVTTFSYY